jgi:AcrR family transcriptional regulator
MAIPDRRRLAPERRTEQLLDAAVTLAAGGDLAALSVEDIAREAGVSVGLLYHYFPTKQALVTAAVRRAAGAFVDDLRAAASGPPLEQLTRGLGAYLDHVEAQPIGWRAILAATSGELKTIGDEVEETSLGLALDALGVAEPSPTIVLTLRGWMQLERSVCLLWLDRPEIDRAAIEDLLVSSFLGAITAAARHDPVSAEALARLA